MSGEPEFGLKYGPEYEAEVPTTSLRHAENLPEVATEM